MPNKTSDSFTANLPSGHLGREVSDAAVEMKDTAVRTFDQSREAAASRLASAASTLRAKAETGTERLSGLARSAADRLDSTANYVKQHDAQSMMADVVDVVKKNPGPSLMIAGVIGFLVGRSLSRR